MKKILIFSLVYYPKHIGGAEVAIKEITDRISPDDIEFHLVCLRMDSTLPTTEKIGNVIVHRIGYAVPNPTMADLGKFPLHLNKAWFQIGAFFAAAKLHKEIKFDAIWAMMAHSCGVPAALFKSRFPNVKYILTLQEGDPPEYIERKMRVFGKWFVQGFTRADVIQAISTFLGAWARSMGFTGRLEIIPNAVNTKKFSTEYSAEELENVRGVLSVAHDDTLLITTSRLVHKNACDDVIKALKLLPETVKFIIAGIGPDEVMLKELAKKEGVDSRVVFLGQLDHTEMPKYLKACDIFIRPSRSEGMGNSFVEAMAAGRPVIATQEGGIADFLYDAKRNPEIGATGWAVDKDSPEQIAEAVKDILANPEQVRETILRAKKMAFDRYDWDLIAKDMREKVFSVAS